VSGNSSVLGTTTVEGNLIIDNTASAANQTFRFNTSGDGTIVGDINFMTSAAEGSDDRIGLIRSLTQAGAADSRGGQLLFYTRQSGSANFNSTSYDKDGNWVFPAATTHTSDIIAQSRIYVDTTTKQTDSLVIGRQNGNIYEFGHDNQAGQYYGVIGVTGSSGEPFIGFSTDVDYGTNTFTTRGTKGSIIKGQNGDLYFQTVTTASASGQTPVTNMRIDNSGTVIIPAYADGNKLLITSSAGSGHSIIEMGQLGSDGFLDVSASGGGIVTHLSGYTGYTSYFLSDTIIGGTAVDQEGSVSLQKNGIIRSVISSGTAGDSLINGITGVSNGAQFSNDASNNQQYLFHNIGQRTLHIQQSGVTLGDTGNNTVLNTQQTLLAGYGIEDASTNELYGSYGWLGFNSNNNYTSSARSIAFTNSYLANQFAMIMGTSSQAMPTLTTAGVLGTGDLVFHVNNAKDFMFGKAVGNANGPHFRVNSYAYSSVFQGSSTGNILEIRSGTETNANVGMIIFKDNGGDTCGQITSNASTNTTSYNTSSDYRLKKDLKDFAGLDMVSKIPVYDFEWKKSQERSYGVLAHELQEVLPQSVVGEKDAEEMQSVDYSKIVPLLVKSIQELTAKIDKLEQKCKCKN